MPSRDFLLLSGKFPGRRPVGQDGFDNSPEYASLKMVGQ